MVRTDKLVARQFEVWLASLVALASLGCGQPTHGTLRQSAAGHHFHDLFESVREAHVELKAKTLTGFAVDRQMHVYVSDPKGRSIWKLDGDTVVAQFHDTGDNLFPRLPWHLECAQSGLWVVDRDPDYGGVYLLNDTTGGVLKKYDVAATPAVKEFGDGRLLLGDRQLFDRGDMNMLHLFTSSGRVIQSFFPEDPNDYESAPLGPANANDLAFDLADDGTIYATQAYDQRVRAFSSTGRQLREFHGECPDSIPPSFKPPLNAYPWQYKVWGAWRDSWTRLVDVQVVGPYVVTHTLRRIGTPGWLDVYVGATGERVSSCEDLHLFPEASTGDLLLMTSEVVNGKFDYVLFGRKPITHETNSKRQLLSTLVTTPDGTQRRLRQFLGGNLTVYLVLNPSTCVTCQEELDQWRELATSHCETITIVGILVGVNTVEEYRTFASEMVFPFVLLLDSAGEVRDELARRADHTLPYKIAVSAEGRIVNEWSGSSLPAEQARVLTSVRMLADCDGATQSRGKK